MILANGNALVVDAFPDTERGRALGMENAFVGVGLGRAVRHSVVSYSTSGVGSRCSIPARHS